MPKTRITPFARLLLFLLFFIPVAYVAASYLNGEDPIANVKGLFGGEEGASAPEESVTYRPEDAENAPPATFENVRELRAELRQLKEDLARTRTELARCRAEDVN